MSRLSTPPVVTRRRFLLTLGAAGACAAVGGGFRHLARRSPVESPSPKLHAARRTGRALGAAVSVLALHEDETRAREAVAAAFAELETVESVMSLYRPESQVCRLNQTRELSRPHPYLVQVLNKARTVSAATDGTFDITVQPLWILYANCVAAGILPADRDIERIREHVDWRRVLVSPERVALTGSGTALTLNGIAQGFAADRVLAALAAHGVRHAMVDTGEIGTLGRREDDDCWTIGIRHPRHADALIRRIRLDDRCVATSGDYETTFAPDYTAHHIFDPRTGRSPRTFQSVTIVAGTGMEADALTKAVFVAGLDRGLELLESFPGAEGFFVLKDGQVRSTSGLRGEA